MNAFQTTAAGPASHLSATDIENLGAELDAIREQVLADRGDRDAAYIRTVITNQRRLELSSRAILLFSLFPPAWVVGTVGLSISKIIENMEIGHNVMHGQWDWMRDPTIHSTSWEWDNVSPSDGWKHSHNQLHHTYTNVRGKDNDLGYGIMRVDENQTWKPMYLVQPLSNAINACIFQYGIAFYDLEIGKFLKGRVEKDDFVKRGRKVLAKIRRHVTRDYVLHPLLSGPSALTTMTANLTANLARNLWTPAIKDAIIGNNGSVTNLPEIPEDIQRIFKTVWEIKQKTLIDMAADRGPYICQSQSLNLFLADPDYRKLSSMHFYTWRKGLKTGIYYLRTKAAASAQKFTVEPTKAFVSTEATPKQPDECLMCSS